MSSTRLHAGLLLALLATSASAAEVRLVWHVENLDGGPVSSLDADRPVNPASVVKLATSWRALEALGPEHRFATTFGVLEEGGRRGLVVSGGADPDFHFENAMLVATALVSAGVSELDGDLHVGPRFWMGWERGAAGRSEDPGDRLREMASRLRSAWEPRAWTGEQRAAWRALAERRGWPVESPPTIRIRGGTRGDAPASWRPLLTHLSQPLLVTLRRFNVFSNNDIERLDASLGEASSLAGFLAGKWKDGASGTSFETSSGLGRNRMTPRQVVRMLQQLRDLLEAKGYAPGDLLPVLGCGPSTLKELFPRLRESGEADGLTGKTGTLNTTDGGVSALAGYLPSEPPLAFFVAAPGAGSMLPRARAAEEDWVRTLLRDHGPLQPLRCPAPVPTSDEQAEVRASVASAG